MSLSDNFDDPLHFLENFPDSFDTDFVILRAKTLNDTYDCNVSLLDFSNQLLMEIEKKAFWKFANLEKINLSNNLLSNLDSELFKLNRLLNEIDLKHNNLKSIPDYFTFDSYRFDLSYNSIERILHQQFFSGSLVDLDLSHNRLQTINYDAFFYLPQLRFLNLSDNKLKSCRLCSIRLKKLTISNNLLQSIDIMAADLSILQAQNNRITRMDKIKLHSSAKLNELDLTDCLRLGINRISNGDFRSLGDSSLRILKLTVHEFFDLNSLQNLDRLTHLEITYYGSFGLYTNSKPFSRMFKNQQNLKTLILILNRFYNYYFEGIVELKNLEDLHVECLDPQDYLECFGIEPIFEKNTRLTNVFLKSLNRLRIGEKEQWAPKQSIMIRELRLLNLGKSKVGTFFNRFPVLVHLNLSGSALYALNINSFEDLVHLRFLYIDDSSLTQLRKQFDQNIELEILSFRNNVISQIDCFVFTCLKHLTSIDLRGNPLKSIDYATVFKDVDLQKTTVYLP